MSGDAGFKAYFAKYGKGWDPPDDNGISGGYRLRRAYELGLKPDAAGHLPDFGPGGEPLKTYMDPNKVTRGVDNGTGYQVAPPTYTGPLTPQIMHDAPRYFHAGTATRPGGPGGWDDVPVGKNAPALTPPKGYQIPPDPADKYMHPTQHAQLDPRNIPALIDSASTDFKVPSRLLASIIANESSFNPRAVSKTGAQGLGQLEPDTAKGLGVSDAFDPRQNVAGAALYLRQLLDRFHNNPMLAVAAYNAGPGAVKRAGNQVPNIPETINYVQNVMGMFEGGR